MHTNPVSLFSSECIKLKEESVVILASTGKNPLA